MALEKRVDPKSTPPSGRRRYDAVTGKRDDLHYVFVDPTNKEVGVDYYEAMGYEKVQGNSKDSPRPVIGASRNGEYVTGYGGAVLMSRPHTDVEADSAVLQQGVDAVERQILKTGGVDGLRGMHGVKVVNNVEPARQELKHG